MEMSKAYEEFIELIRSDDCRKGDLYSIGLFDRIYDSEVEKVEDLIWETFHKKKDTGLLIFFPKLKKYDGINALRKLVNDYKIPSELNMTIAYLLYESTKENYYLKLMEKNIVMSQYHFSYIAMMTYLNPCEDLYQTFVRIYINCSEEIALTSCINGILYNKGFIKNIYDLNQTASMRDLRVILKKVPKYERKMMIKKLEKGEFDQYKYPV